MLKTHAMRAVNLVTHYGKTFKYPAALYFATWAVMGVYFTDWKVIVTKIPFYRNSFKEEEK